ncbi:hypothetical protein ACFQ3N_19280 [Virgibacillus byunsanensis]|uniref:Secreted protein n=1 Tax=Virgibacillus byunsanensis TaxID=570945 RepID=A0ABW3LU06_9BACI
MKKPWYKKVWVWVVAVIVIIAISTGDAEEEAEAGNKTAAETDTEGSTEDVTEEDVSQEQTEPEESEEEPENEAGEDQEEVVEETPQEKMFNQVLTLMDEGLAFDTGSYVKGDIPEGEYAFISFDGSGKYYGETDSAGNIIDNENFDSFGYVYVHDADNLETRGALISVEAFDDLEVSGAKEIYEKINNVEDYKGSGMYKVGYDIEPNQYTIESMGQGYVAVLSGPIGDNEIVNNEILNGKYNVNVSDGQFLQISKGEILE